jgi:hypothetical protein
MSESRLGTMNHECGHLAGEAAGAPSRGSWEALNLLLVGRRCRGAWRMTAMRWRRSTAALPSGGSGGERQSPLGSGE